MAKKSETKLEDEKKDIAENNGEKTKEITDEEKQKKETEGQAEAEQKLTAENNKIENLDNQKKGGKMTRVYVKNPRLKFLSKVTKDYINFIPGILKTDDKESYVGYYDTNNEELVEEMKQTSYFLRTVEIK